MVRRQPQSSSHQLEESLIPGKINSSDQNRLQRQSSSRAFVFAKKKLYIRLATNYNIVAV
jgi:hypothetical protein